MALAVEPRRPSRRDARPALDRRRASRVELGRRRTMGPTHRACGVIASAVDRLIDYVCHKPWCNAGKTKAVPGGIAPKGPCTCGLAELLAELEGERTTCDTCGGPKSLSMFTRSTKCDDPWHAP